MSTASSIKKALKKVGIAYTIKRSSADISGEYCIYDTSILSSRIFVKEHNIDATLAYDTQAVPGDILLFSTGTNFMVAHKNPEALINTPIFYDAALLKCNVTEGKVMRASGEIWGASYRKIPVWQTVKSNLVGVCTQANLTQPNRLDEEDYANLSIGKMHLYYPSGEDIRVLDRVEPKSGEYYKVDTIREWLYPGITIAEISEDTR